MRGREVRVTLPSAKARRAAWAGSAGLVLSESAQGWKRATTGTRSSGRGVELAAGVGDVAGEVVAAGFGDPGEVFDAAAFGGEGHDLDEDALLVAGPLGEAVDELVAVVADAVTADEGVLVDVGAEGGQLEEERPVGKGLDGGEDRAGLEEGFARRAKAAKLTLGPYFWAVRLSGGPSDCGDAEHVVAG